jgi:hypothetical protein
MARQSVREVWEGFKDRLQWLAEHAGFAHMSRRRRWAVIIAAAVVAVLGLALAATWDDIQRTGLNPTVPFQTYVPPKAPDYADAHAWALNPVAQNQHFPTGPVDVFFVHPTTFNGGINWNGPIDDVRSQRQLEKIMLPNYAGPFLRVGRIFAPRYRQASLFAMRMNLSDDSREARGFAYGDVLKAFRYYMAHYNLGRPFIIVGVEQGALIADRLLREEVGRNPGLVQKMPAAYLIDALVPASGYGPGKPIPACTARGQPRCVLGWMAVDQSDPRRARELLNRALVWTPEGQLVNLDQAPPLCVNPLLGAQTEVKAPARLNLGAANASELEWGLRAAFLPRQVSAQCDKGILRVSSPRSGSLRPSGAWPDKFKVPPYNAFFADIEADAMKRVATYYGRADFPPGAPPIEQSVTVQAAPVHTVD